MAKQRRRFRFRIPWWLGAAPVRPRRAITRNQTSRSDTTPKPTLEAQDTSSTNTTGTRTGSAPTTTETAMVQHSPSSPPPSPPRRAMPMSARTVFSPRLTPRSSADESETTSQLTTPLQSPPPSVPASLLSSPTQPADPQQPVAATPPQAPPRYFFGASPDRKASPEPPVKPEPEQVTKPDTSPRFQHRQTPEPKTSLEPPLPSEKIVPESPIGVVPPKPRVEVEKGGPKEASGGDKKPEKGKGPLKGGDKMPKSPRTVFSPRLTPRSSADESETTSQLTTPLQSPPPSVPASLLSSPTQSADPQQPVAATPPQTPPRYFFGASPDSKASPEPPVKPEPEQVTKPDTSPGFQHRQTPESKTSLEPPLPSEKIVPERPIVVVPPKPRVEVEMGGPKEASGGDKKPEKGKGPLKGGKSKTAPKPEDSRGKSKRASPTYTFRYKPPPPPPPSLQKGIKEDVLKLIQELTTGRPKKYQIGETPVDIVTLVGENKGAVMRLGSESSSKNISFHIRRGYKTDPNSSTEATTDSEDDGDKEKFNQTEEQSEAEACINSNVQGVNNSMVFDSSVSEKISGVHMDISVADIEEERSPASEKSSSSEEEQEALPETRRSEFSPTPSERLIYQPVVKRRWLRGLFMESSDSDLDDPTKPRSHGCGEKSKDKGNKGINIS